MKKFLLSSIIMLGVCGAVNAQTETGSKFKKNNAATSTSAVALTPQKAAVMAPSDDLAPAQVADTRTAADKEAAAAAPAPTRVKGQAKTAQAASAVTTVNAAGEIVPAEAKQKTQGVKKN